MLRELFLPMYMFDVYKYYHYNYQGLTDEERYYLEYVDECMFNKDERIQHASLKMLLLILELRSTLGTKKEMSVQEVKEKKEEILKDFNNDERELLDIFSYACINSIGIFSKEAETERKLRKERNDK